MSEFCNDEWPNLNSISISFGGLTQVLSIEELGALHKLVWFAASRCVYSAYSSPDDVLGFPDDVAKICRIVGCSEKKWASLEQEVLQFFELRCGNWVLANDDFIRIAKRGRSAVPTSVKLAVGSRDAMRCVYCGDENGPFHLDHLWPVSKGGSDEPNNLVMSCADCNLSKGNKSLREWVGGSA